MTNLGSRLRQAMEQLGKNQSEFAQQLGITQSFVSKILLGKSEVGSLFLLAVEHVFGISSAWLKTGDGAPFVENRFPDTRPGKMHVDIELLTAILSAVDETLNKNSLSLSRKKKAELVGLLYENELLNPSAEQGKLDHKAVLRLIKLAS